MSFLPERIYIKTDETIKEYVERLHNYYLEELKTEKFTYNNLFIYHNTEPDIDNKDGGFWHIITKDYLNQKRRVVSIPCKASNGMMICTHLCNEFHSYDPYRTEEIFYNNGKKVDPRFICLNRCERISWIKPIIKESEINPNKFKIWEKRARSHQIKTHIWYEEEDFLIVLGRWRNELKYNMITSFITNYKQKRKECEKNYQKYLNNDKNPI